MVTIEEQIPVLTPEPRKQNQYYKLNDAVYFGKVPDDNTGVTIYADESECIANNPEIEAAKAEGAINGQKRQIDLDSGVNIAETHAKKAEEARRVKFDSIDTSDPDIVAQLVYLAPEAISRGMTIPELADMVWAKHEASAALDNARIAAKLAVQ